LLGLGHDEFAKSASARSLTHRLCAHFRSPVSKRRSAAIGRRRAACCALACHDVGDVATSPEAPSSLPTRRRCARSRKRVTIFITLNAGRSSALPLYEYKCAKCAHQFEKIEKHNAPTTQKCPKCGGKAERMISAAGIQFKGSGWYVTDYKGKNSGASSVEGSGDGASGKSSESSSDSKSADAKSQDSKTSDAKTGESKSDGAKSGDSKSSGEKGSSKKKK
jgi:putative FmdB family regulatory protein